MNSLHNEVEPYRPWVELPCPHHCYSICWGMHVIRRSTRHTSCAAMVLVLSVSESACCRCAAVWTRLTVSKQPRQSNSHSDCEAQIDPVLFLESPRTFSISKQLLDYSAIMAKPRNLACRGIDGDARTPTCLIFSSSSLGSKVL